MSGSDDNSTEGGLVGSLRRAFDHAEGAARCYLALLAVEGRRQFRRFKRETAWIALLVGAGIIGLALLGYGLAVFVDSRVDLPGAGFVIVGGLMVIGFFVMMFVIESREER